jgi:hypothetical protein
MVASIHLHINAFDSPKVNLDDLRAVSISPPLWGCRVEVTRRRGSLFVICQHDGFYLESTAMAKEGLCSPAHSRIPAFALLYSINLLCRGLSSTKHKGDGARAFHSISGYQCSCFFSSLRHVLNVTSVPIFPATSQLHACSIKSRAATVLCVSSYQ